MDWHIISILISKLHNYFRQKQHLENEFKKTASGYGKMISHLGCALEGLSNGEVNIVSKFYF